MASNDGHYLSIHELDAAVQARLGGMGRERLREMLDRAVTGKFRMCVPPQPDDDDLILDALIDEYLSSRQERKG